jgi:hypothetical protein
MAFAIPTTSRGEPERAFRAHLQRCAVCFPPALEPARDRATADSITVDLGVPQRRSCGHETLLRRPPAQKHRKSCPPRRRLKVRCRPPLRRQPLLRQTLLKDRRSRVVPPAEEGRWKATEDRPDYEEAARGRRRGASHDGHRIRQTPLTAKRHGQGPERLHRRAAIEEDGLQPKKRTPVGRWNATSSEEPPGG